MRPAIAVGRLSRSPAALSMSSGSITASSPRRIHRRSRWRRCTINTPARSWTASRRRSRSSISRRSTDPRRRKPSPAASVTAARPRWRPAPTAPSSRRGATSIRATSATSRSRARATADARSRPPVRVSEDKWELEGCPDDGPAMAIDARNGIHIVWPTLVTESAGQTIALFYASSADGRTFTTRERIPTEGMPHHPQIASAADGSLALAWDELAGACAAPPSRATVNATGRPTFARTIVSGADLPCIRSSPEPWIPRSSRTSGRSPESVIRGTDAPARLVQRVTSL